MSDAKENLQPVLLALGTALLVHLLLSGRRRNEACSDNPRAAVQSIPLLPGVRGTYQTLAHMAEMVKRDGASQYVRQLATRIVADCPGHGFDCEIEQVFKFVRDIPYRRDPYHVERVQDTRRTVELNSADCYCKIVALCSLLAAIGKETRFVVCGFRANHFSNVYAQVSHNGKWIALDPTNERAEVGWRPRAAVRQAYKIF